MFHVLLVLPFLAAYGAAALLLLAIPFCVGCTLQLIFSVFSVSRLVLLVPAMLGGLGLICSLFFLLETVPLAGILLYWGLFFLSLWLVWLVVSQIKKAIVRWRGGMGG